MKEKFGDRINIQHRCFLLRAEPDPTVVFNDYRRGHWERADTQEDGGTFRAWHSDAPFPSHSLPSAEASSCATLQGEEAFHRYHFALLKAIFEDSRNISDPDVLIRIAEEQGLDVSRFKKNLLSGSQKDKVLREHLDGIEQFGVQAIPTVIFGRKQAVVGSVPREEYEKVIELIHEPSGT